MKNFASHNRSNTTNVMRTSNIIAIHAWENNNIIDFENAHIVNRCSHSMQHKTLESWHTGITKAAENNSEQLRGHYEILLRKILT